MTFGLNGRIYSIYKVIIIVSNRIQHEDHVITECGDCMGKDSM